MSDHPQAQTGSAVVCPTRANSGWAFLAGLILILFSVVVLGVGRDVIGSYFDIPSLAILLGITIGGWLIAFGPGLSKRLFVAVLTGHFLDEAQARKAVDFCSCGIWLLLLAGTLGTLIGLISMHVIGFFSGANPDVLCSAMAVDVLTFFWSWGPAIPLVALRYRAAEAAATMARATGVPDK